MEIITNSPGQTTELARLAGKLAKPGTVLVLAGPLGAGKTSFVQGLAKGLGIPDVVNSPTYTIVKEYRGRLPLYHFDLYRLEDPDELWDLGLEEYFASGGVCALEWGERAAEMLPREHLHIRLELMGEFQRALFLRASGERHNELVKELMEHAGTGH